MGISNYSNSLKGTISMNTYHPNSNYRKIYESHYGPIPKDSDGRTYDIHHIDGDRTNNHLSNLIAVSIKDHYDIHHLQNEFGACLRIAQRMDLTPAEISAIARKNGLSNKGSKRTAETKSKMRLKKLGIKQIEKQKAHLYNRVVTEESRIKSRQSNLGQTRSEQTCNNIRNAVNLALTNGSHPSQIKCSCLNCKRTVSITNLKQHSCL